MNISEVKRTMHKKGIPKEVTEQFVYPKTAGGRIAVGTPEEKFAFARLMDKLLSKEQILTVMEEQGCNKYEHTAESMSKFQGKTIQERVEIINAQWQEHELYCKLDSDGTLSVLWGYKDKDKYVCICPCLKKMAKPAASITYCGCCSGHIKHHFEQDLGVKLRLLETVSSPLSSGGEKQCEHRYEIIRNAIGGDFTHAGSK